MQNDDKSLIEAHLRGDKAAFEHLVRRYGGSVLGYLTRISGNRQRAEDLFQETFKRVHEKAHQLRSDQFKGWLFKIATNVAMDGMRRKKPMKPISLNQTSDCTNGCDSSADLAVADTSTEPSRQVIRAEQRQQVRNCIESLPDKQRTTLVLAYYEQLSYSQVAQVLNCSVGTVKTQMYRALKKLAKQLPDIDRGPK
jgi:RNA polymerase sigma-70 factor (ECF subfamily)